MRREQAELLRGAVRALRSGLDGIPIDGAAPGRIPAGGPPTLTGTQALVLAAAAERGDEAYPSDIARAAGLRLTNVSSAISDLRRKGLVGAPITDTVDRRRRVVRVTSAGRTLLHARREAQIAWLTGAAAGLLTATEQARLAAAIPLLHRLAAAAESAAADGADDSAQAACKPGRMRGAEYRR